jgi:hypothetical protein
MITSEQFQEWKTHPVTKELFTELKKTRQSIVDQLANGNSIGPDAQATHGFTNRAVGQIDGLNQLLNISFEGDSVDNEVDEVSGY